MKIILSFLTLILTASFANAACNARSCDREAYKILCGNSITHHIECKKSGDDVNCESTYRSRKHFTKTYPKPEDTRDRKINGVDSAGLHLTKKMLALLDTFSSEAGQSLEAELCPASTATNENNSSSEEDNSDNGD